MGEWLHVSWHDDLGRWGRGRRRAGRTIMIITVKTATNRASPPDTNRSLSEIQPGNEEHSPSNTVAVVESGSSEVELDMVGMVFQAGTKVGDWSDSVPSPLTAAREHTWPSISLKPPLKTTEFSSSSSASPQASIPLPFPTP